MSREGNVDNVTDQCPNSFTSGILRDVIHASKSQKNKKLSEGWGYDKVLTDICSHDCLLFRLAGTRYQNRREGWNVRPQIHHVLSRKGEDQPVTECLAKVSSSNPRVEDRRQGVAAERSEESL